MTSFARLFGSWGYGFSDKGGKFRSGIDFFPFGGRSYSLGFERYRDMGHRPDADYYDPITISLQALLAKDDYRDYYLRNGWTTYLSGRLRRDIFVRAQYISEEHRSVRNATDFSLFSRGRPYRQNPAVLEGDLRSVVISMRYGDEPVPLQIVSRRAIEFEIEQSSDPWFQSDFEFTRWSLRVEWHFVTFYRRYLFPATLRIVAAAGTSRGTVPPQRTFDLETRSSGIAPFGVLRGATVKEFFGDRAVTFAVEHNFRSIPFLALGIPFLYKNSVELVVHGAIAQTWIENPRAIVQTGGVLKPTEGWYSEAGFGINRILGILRIDLTWRFKKPRNIFLTGGFAVLF